GRCGGAPAAAQSRCASAAAWAPPASSSVPGTEGGRRPGRAPMGRSPGAETARQRPGPQSARQYPGAERARQCRVRRDRGNEEGPPMGKIEARVHGGGFLLGPAEDEAVFTPEQLDEDTRQIGALAEDFTRNQVLPRLEELEQGNHEHSVALLRAAEIGRAHV